VRKNGLCVIVVVGIFLVVVFCLFGFSRHINDQSRRNIEKRAFSNLLLAAQKPTPESEPLVFWKEELGEKGDKIAPELWALSWRLEFVFREVAKDSSIYYWREINSINTFQPLHSWSLWQREIRRFGKVEDADCLRPLVWVKQNLDDLADSGTLKVSCEKVGGKVSIEGSPIAFLLRFSDRERLARELRTLWICDKMEQQGALRDKDGKPVALTGLDPVIVSEILKDVKEREAQAKTEVVDLCSEHEPVLREYKRNKQEAEKKRAPFEKEQTRLTADANELQAEIDALAERKSKLEKQQARIDEQLSRIMSELDERPMPKKPNTDSLRIKKGDLMLLTEFRTALESIPK